jgi:hypothetical protein
MAVSNQLKTSLTTIRMNNNDVDDEESHGCCLRGHSYTYLMFNRGCNVMRIGVQTDNYAPFSTMNIMCSSHLSSIVWSNNTFRCPEGTRAVHAVQVIRTDLFVLTLREACG